MSWLIALAPLALAAWIMWEWLYAEHVSVRLPAGAYAVGVALSVALSLAMLVPKVRWVFLQNDLSQVATVLAETSATVHCQGVAEDTLVMDGYAGFVKGHADGTLEMAASLDRDICQQLRQLRSDLGDGIDPADVSSKGLFALHVLTHESMHMRGERDESRTDCQAIQRNAKAAELLGASQPQAQALGLRIWDEMYEPGRMGYGRSGSCVPGEAWDEALPTSPWVMRPMG